MSNQSMNIKENWDMSIESNNETNELDDHSSEAEIVLPDTITLSKDGLLAIDQALQVSFTSRFHNKREELQNVIADMENEKKLLTGEMVAQRSKCELENKNMEEKMANKKKLLTDEMIAQRSKCELENKNMEEKMANKKKLLTDEIVAERNKWELEKKIMNERFPLGDNSTVRIDVGGQIFKAKRSIFETEPGASTILGIALSGRHERLDSNEADIFIDRDPLTFRHILNFLRGHNLGYANNFSPELIKFLFQEGTYYLMPPSFFILLYPEYVKERHLVQVKCNNVWKYGLITQIVDNNITVLYAHSTKVGAYYPMKRTVCDFFDMFSHIREIEEQNGDLDDAIDDLEDALYCKLDGTKHWTCFEVGDIIEASDRYGWVQCAIREVECKRIGVIFTGGYHRWYSLERDMDRVAELGTKATKTTKYYNI